MYACRVSDEGGQLQFTQVKSGDVSKDDFNTTVRAFDSRVSAPCLSLRDNIFFSFTLLICATQPVTVDVS